MHKNRFSTKPALNPNLSGRFFTSFRMTGEGFRITIIFIVSFLPILLFATDTRVSSLGGVNELIIDNSNVKGFPALATIYTNEIIAEIKDPSLICLLGLGKFGVMGIDINSDSFPTIIRRTIYKTNIDVHGPSCSKFNIYYGKSPIGIKVGQYSFYRKKTSTDALQEIFTYNVSLGIRHSEDKKYSLDLAGGIENFELKGTKGGIEPYFEGKGNISYWAKLRLSSKISESSTFLIGVNYENYNISCNRNRSDTTEDMTTQNMEGYVGINVSPVSNTNIILGLWGGVMEGDTSTEDTTFSNTTTVLPKIIIGVENELNKWLVVRTGITKSWLNSEAKKASDDGINFNTETNREAPYSLSLGWGIKFNNFELDIISNDILFITPSIKLGATYKFSR